MENIKRKKEAGLTLPELLIVAIVIGILAAIAIPLLLGSKRGVEQKLAVAQLADFKRAQTAYKDDLNNPAYATLQQLRNTSPGGNPLIDPLMVNPDGTGRDYKGWTVEQIQAPTASTFALKLMPSAGNPADYSFFIYEDGVVRRTALTGPWTRGTGTIVE